MILLCCKEANPSKQKNKMMGRPMTDKKGRPKLQLKGRIFMQNVTDTVCSSKPG
jgi:cell division control protein 24